MSRTHLRLTSVFLALGFLILTGGCQDDSVAPLRQDSIAVDQGSPEKAANNKVIIFATVTGVEGNELVVSVPVPVDPDEASDVLWSEVLAGQGITGRPLRVAIDPEIQVEHEGGEWFELQAGTPVMIAGDLDFSGLTARYIFDPRAMSLDPGSVPDIQTRGSWEIGPPLDLPYPADVLPGPGSFDPSSAALSRECTEDFPGEFGGPSWSFDTGSGLDIPVYWTPLLWVQVDRIRPTIGLGGGHYNFPFSFTVEEQAALVVGESGSLTIQAEPQSPDNDQYSYFWALGINIEFTFEICVPILGCEDFEYNLSLLSTVNATEDPAPMEGEQLDIAHKACPEIPIIAIPETPISVLGLQLCQDQTIKGHAFEADVTTHGFFGSRDFNHIPEVFSVRPVTNPLAIDLRELEYVPDVAIGISLQISVFTIPIYDTPGIDVSQGPMSFIPTSSTSCGSFFNVNTCGKDQPTAISLELPTIPVVTWITAQPDPTRYGETVRLEALVRGANGPGDSPREVGFFDGDIHLATVPIDEADMAVLEVSDLEPCRHEIHAKFVGVDGEGVSYPSEKTTVIIVTGEADNTRPEGYWQHECGRNGITEFDTETMECYLAIAQELSTVFGEFRDASTLEAAYDVLFLGDNHGSALDQFDRELLVAWLNYANGAYRFTEMLDTGKSEILDLPFNELMAMAEVVRLDPAATKKDIKDMTRMLHHIKNMAETYRNRSG